jgi:hypothetical protein
VISLGVASKLVVLKIAITVKEKPRQIGNNTMKRQSKQSIMIERLRAADPTVTIDPTPGWTLCTCTGVTMPTVCGLIIYAQQTSNPTPAYPKPYFVDLKVDAEFRPRPSGNEAVFPASAVRGILTGQECADYIESLYLPYFDRVR